MVKNYLKQWVNQHYQEPAIKKIEIVKEMETLQENMEKMEITRELLIREIELEKSLQVILRQDEESWRLRSRVIWLKGGIKIQNSSKINAESIREEIQ